LHSLQLIKPIKTVVACCVEPRLVDNDRRRLLCMTADVDCSQRTLPVDCCCSATQHASTSWRYRWGGRGQGAPRTYRQCILV